MNSEDKYYVASGHVMTLDEATQLMFAGIKLGKLKPMTDHQKSTFEKIKVMEAYVKGKSIQYSDDPVRRAWYDIENGDRVSWDWYKNDYRIKPEPREVWMRQSLGEWVEVCKSVPDSVLFREVLP